MRVVRTIDSPVVALFIADVHLSMRPPCGRQDEPNWLAAMERPLAELRQLAEKHDAIVLCAGDIFDNWNVPPELINWAIERLPHLHAIPGNHDLPNHRPELSYRSAYGTLVRAGKITELAGWPTLYENLAIYGRPFGEDMPTSKDLYAGNIHKPELIHILVTHQFLWVPGATHHDAPEECRLGKVAKEFGDFDLVIVGDNHAAFDRVLDSGTHVVNCGSFLRRKVNEFPSRPRIGMIHASGAVTFHTLSTEHDILREDVSQEQEQADDNPEITHLIEGLTKLEASSLNFRDMLVAAMRKKKVNQDVKEILLEAMEDHA